MPVCVECGLEGTGSEEVGQTNPQAANFIEKRAAMLSRSSIEQSKEKPQGFYSNISKWRRCSSL